MTEPDKENPKPPSDMLVHPPLPYVVRLREIPKGDEDTQPLTHDRHIVAYSVMEAMLQALLEAGGSGLEDSRFKVESIGPDMDAYGTMLRKHSFTALFSRR